MGLHTGAAEGINTPHGPDYAARSLNEAARAVSAAHGGQILLTGAAYEHVYRLGDGEVCKQTGHP